MRGRENRCCQIPYRLKRFPHNRRSAEQYSVCKFQFANHLRCIRLHHIIGSHVHGAAVTDSAGNLFGQLFCISIGADIGNYDCLLVVRIGDGTPLLVHLKDFPYFCVQHRSVPRADHDRVQFLHTLQRFHHKSFKRPYYTVKVISGRFVVIFLVSDFASEHPLHTVMGSEGIAGYEYLILLNPCIHRIRPMKIRYRHERKRLVPNFHRFIILNLDTVEIPVHNVFQEINRTAGCDDFHVGIDVQQKLHTACMIRLRVIHHKVINLFNFRDLFKLSQILIEEFSLRRLKKHRFIPCFKYIGVIRGAEFRQHNNIEYPQVLIYYSCPVKIFL